MLFGLQNYHEVKGRGEHLLFTFTHELQTLNIHLEITQASHMDLGYSTYMWDDVVNEYILRITCLKVKPLNSLQTCVPQWMVAPMVAFENFSFFSKLHSENIKPFLVWWTALLFDFFHTCANGKYKMKPCFHRESKHLCAKSGAADWIDEFWMNDGLILVICTFRKFFMAHLPFKYIEVTSFLVSADFWLDWFGLSNRKWCRKYCAF